MGLNFSSRSRNLFVKISRSRLGLEILHNLGLGLVSGLEILTKPSLGLVSVSKKVVSSNPVMDSCSLFLFLLTFLEAMIYT